MEGEGRPPSTLAVACIPGPTCSTYCRRTPVQRTCFSGVELPGSSGRNLRGVSWRRGPATATSILVLTCRSGRHAGSAKTFGAATTFQTLRWRCTQLDSQPVPEVEALQVRG